MKQSVISERQQANTVASLAGHRTLIPALAVGLVLLCLLFLPEGQAAVEVWNASTAYSHCYLILPMTLYLLRERWGVVRTIGPKPEPILALAAIPIAVAWLVAERLGFMEGRQLAAVASIELFLCAILGRRLFWQLSGPLLFLFFLVPFGAFLTPVLQRFTAAFSIIGLNVLGIPNFSDGFTIETPSGVFFVAEACAGLRFLIAAIAFGVFYALLNYTSPTRRACFILASIVIPILANGIRALGIIVLGQILGSAEAAAADHIIYGWVFFTIVMLLLIAGGQIFREQTPTVYQPVQTGALGTKRSAPVAALFSVALLSLGPAVASLIDARVVTPEFSETFSVVAPTGCVITGKSGPTSRSTTTMTCGGVPFELRVNLFAPRSTSSAMVAERRRVTQEISAEDVAIAVADVSDSVGRWTIVQTTDPDRLTAYASWVDGAPVRSGTAGRVAQARDSLFGGNYAAALITITSVEPDKSSPAQRKLVRQRLIDVVNGQMGLDDKMSDYTNLAAH